MIEKVVHEKNVDSHENDERTIITLTVKGSEGFAPDKIKIVRLKREATLGNHWKEFPEIYGIIGHARFTLQDIETREQRHYDMNTGDRLYVPARVALKVLAKSGAVIVACSPEADSTRGSYKYEIN